MNVEDKALDEIRKDLCTAYRKRDIYGESECGGPPCDSCDLETLEKWKKRIKEINEYYRDIEK